MKLDLPNVATVVIFIASLLAIGPGQAQGIRWQPFISITATSEGTGDLDHGGDFSVVRATSRVGVVGDRGGGNRVGVTLDYDYADYSFSNPVALGGVAPWNIVQRYGVAVPLVFALRDDWSLGVLPSVHWSKENGAKAGDSLVWGGIVSATKRFADDKRLGFGLGVFDRIEKTSAIPFLIVDWRFSDRWRLINPLAAGPTGAAGLELDYRFDNDWAFGIGGAWRVKRFRLSETGPVPNGVGEERGLPVFLRATRSLGAQMSFHFYAGVVTAGELRVENPSGNVLRKVDYDPAPFIGATLIGRF